MHTDIYFYSGSGNSLWAARRLAEELGDTALHPIPKTGAVASGAPDDAVGIVFPVHMWGVPRRVLQFIELLPRNDSRYYFAAAINAGQVSATLLQLRDVMSKKGLALSAGFDLLTPTNYIPWGGPGPEEKWKARLTKTDEKIRSIAPLIAQRQTLPVEKGPLWQRIIFTWLYHLAFSHVPEMDKSFYTDERCNSCGVCAKVCPASNIRLEEGKPRWLRKCEQCLACIQWCPRESIQYGKKTPQYPRYHNPNVTLNDMIGCAPQTGKAE